MLKKLLITLFLLSFSSILYPQTIGDWVSEEALSPVEMYKNNYILFGDKGDQVKAYTSFKYSLLKRYKSGLFLGYSQKLMWSLYERSSPFWDINYSPEVFIKSKYIFSDYVDFIKFGLYEHNSNGRDGPESRSIDRGYVQSQWSMGNKVNFGVNLKGFYYYSMENKNSDYNRYSNYYEAKVFLSLGETDDEDSKDEIYVKFGGLDKGFVEGGFISRKIWVMNPRLYVQAYHGYVESLLRYDERETRIRLGIIFK